MNEKKNMVLSTNSKYLMPTAVCILSIIENNREKIDFFILNSGLTDDEILYLKKVALKYNNLNSLLSVKVDSARFDHCPTRGRSKEAYFRLLIPYLLPKDIKRCLYLDSDTIVQCSLNDFYNDDFEKKAMIVCEDIGEILFYSKKMHDILGIPIQYKYFNSGVLLFNLDYFRSNVEQSKIFDFVENNCGKLKFLDQDVFNSLFYDKVKYFNGSNNNYIEILVNPMITNDGIKNANIIHFIQKPWKISYNGVNSSYWWKYAKNDFKSKYYGFMILNFIYKKSLGLLTIFIPLRYLKNVKRYMHK